MKTTISLAFLAGVNILIAFGQLWYIVVSLGPGIETDALYAGMVVPQLVLAVVGGSLTHVLVPILSAESEGDFSRDAWTFFFLITALFGAVALGLGLSSGYWVPWMVPGFPDSAKALTKELVQIQLVGMVGTAAVSVLWSVFHARRQFVWVETSPVLANFFAFGFLVWGLPKFGVSIAAWSAVLSAVFQVCLLLYGLGPIRRPDWKSPALRLARRRIKPLIAGTIYYKTDPLIDRFLASMAPAGGLSLLYIAQQVFGAANQVINKAIAAPTVPVLAEYAVQRDWRSFRQIYRKKLGLVAMITGTGYLAFLFLGERALHFLIGYGDVTDQNVRMLWWLTALLGGVLIGGAIGQLTSIAFYAQGDTKTPTILGVWSYTVYVPIKFIAFFVYGLVGLAVSTILFCLVNGIIQHVALQRRFASNV